MRVSFFLCITLIANALKVNRFGKGAWSFSGGRRCETLRPADDSAGGGSTLRCTSIDPADALDVSTPAARGKKPNQRFIHPQVYKMFHRAQYLMKTGENAVAQRLLLRCLELNPFDSHR